MNFEGESMQAMGKDGDAVGDIVGSSVGAGDGNTGGSVGGGPGGAVGGIFPSHKSSIPTPYAMKDIID
eukprot:CAMPEP_0204648754 /NCGR_PEP_ID=MMETSP0718-20130828/8377_1 /ASSEMBLY_ACC=CAM_ASM_000674 /TAXON_ID=230516 /ORGANISM="Chaetoceros curvisetus" /LENGTH=67 /DNA_ID=CAMNT_0051671663 /DNA_START=493 /DNA_END=694 /DNA_ORIENTATION=+